MTKSLEIGPSDCPLEGDWDTLDAVDVTNPTYIAKWGYDPLPIEDNTYDLVFASHVIEHIPWYQVEDALQEIKRILKPGGSFEVWTINFEYVVDCYLKKKKTGKWTCQGRIKHWMHSINGRVFAYERHNNPYMWHKALFDRPYLRNLLSRAGFTQVRDLKKTRGVDHGEVNMGVAGIKPDGKRKATKVHNVQPDAQRPKGVRGKTAPTKRNPRRSP
jgi:predicted SAM-dependent methyltransferase